MPRERPAVSNKEPIDVEVTLMSSGNHGGSSLAREGALTFVATRLQNDGTWQRVPYVIRAQRFSHDGNIEHAFVSLFVPIDEPTRRVRIKKVMDDAFFEGEARGLVGRHFAEEVKQHQDEVVSFMDNLLLENDVGIFELVGIFRPEQGTGQGGESRSRPVRFEVHDIGPS